MVSSAKSFGQSSSGNYSAKEKTPGQKFGSAINSAKEFLSDNWNNFTDWIKGDVKDFVDDALSTVTGKDLVGNLGSLKDSVKGQLEDIDDFIEEKTGKDTAGHLESLSQSISGGSSTTPQSGSSAKPIVYSDWSPGAKQFGMDQQTAYAEHMVNTAHQREVADLRAAGLNPVLGVGSGASGVSGQVAISTSGSSAQKSLNGDFIVDAIGATAAVVTAILTKNPAFGYMAGNAVNAVGDLATKSKYK